MTTLEDQARARLKKDTKKDGSKCVQCGNSCELLEFIENYSGEAVCWQCLESGSK